MGSQPKCKASRLVPIIDNSDDEFSDLIEMIESDDSFLDTR